MELSKRCAHQPGSPDWRRGEEYFRRGAVEIVNQGLTGLTAAVQGSASVPYIVELDWSKATQETLFVSCSCPRFDDVGVCKHVFATILAADAAGLGESVPGRTALYLEPARPPWKDSPMPMRMSTRSTTTETMTGAQGARRTRVPLAVTSRASIIVPRTSSRPLSQAGRRKVHRCRSGKKLSPPWSNGRRMSFPRTRDARRSSRGKSGTCWTWRERRSRGWPCLSLYQRILKKDGTLGKLKPLTLSRDEVTELESVEDQTLIGLLAGNERSSEQSNYGYSYYAYYSPLNAFAVAPDVRHFDAEVVRIGTARLASRR